MRRWIVALGAVATVAGLAFAPLPVEDTTRIHSSVEIARDPDVVFAYVTTPANWPTWHPSSLAVSGAVDHPLDIGEQVTEDFLVAGRRGRAKAPRSTRPPSTHLAMAPGEVWCWDMTYLPAVVAGQWFYLYLILDLYSRKIVGWEVHDSDDGEHAKQLLKRTALAEGIAQLERKPVLHGDNGATLKATTVLAMLHWLGVKPSYSRPRVSDDNAFVESLFKTAKYRPQFPSRGFADLAAARQWASEFVHWYNMEHRHSGIQYVTPAQRHSGQDVDILRARDQLYQNAKQQRPHRWTRRTRNWDHVAVVTLNPERDQPVTLAASLANLSIKAA